MLRHIMLRYSYVVMPFPPWHAPAVLMLIKQSSPSSALHACPPSRYTVLQKLPVMSRSCTWTSLCRLAQVREPMLRGATLLYLAVQSFVMMPSVLPSASIAEVQALPFLARYSNVATLVASSLPHMVQTLSLPCCLRHKALPLKVATAQANQLQVSGVAVCKPYTPMSLPDLCIGQP